LAEPHLPDFTAAYVPQDSSDGATTDPQSAAKSVLAALTVSLPGLRPVHLRDPEAEESGFVERPNSREAPAPGGAGRYQMFGEIARGGMGAILRGRDPDLGREVAVKVLREEHRNNPLIFERFVEEAQIGGQLQHPGIVPVYELGQFADRRPFFTMKLVKGRTLAALLADRADPADEQARHLSKFAQICLTVAYAHARGVIHRDLKPSNVMVGHFGEVQVMDWGLAKVLAQGGIADDAKANGSPEAQPNLTEVRTVRTGGSPTETLAGSLLGTPAYMAPEQARGETALVDERADVFGLGAILCEILTGRPPFLGVSQAEVQRKAAVAALDDAMTRLDGCLADAELVTLTKRCLTAEPWGRPRDAKSVADAVSGYIAATDERLRRAERERAVAEARAVEERKRRRVSMALAGSLVLLLGLGGISAWWWSDRQAAAVRSAEAALAQVDEYRGRGQWSDARAALERAEAVMPDRVPADLGRRVASARAELTLLLALDEVRVRHSDMRDVMPGDGLSPPDGAGLFEAAAADRGYAAAFRDFGLDVDKLEPASAAAHVPDGVREPVASALDHWATVRVRDLNDRPGWQKRLEIARAVDAPDPWRQQMRDARLKDDGRSIEQLATRSDRAAQPPDILIHLARDLRDMRSNPILAAEILRECQREHPDDFWVHFELGQTCMRLPNGQAEAARHFAAALSGRPRNALVMTNLAWALANSAQNDEAIVYCRRAAKLRPDYDWPHGLLGFILDRQKRFAEGLAEDSEAVSRNPKGAVWHNNRGWALLNLNRLAEAEAAFREALRLRPDFDLALDNLTGMLNERGRSAEATTLLRESVARKPGAFWVHDRLVNATNRPADTEAAVKSIAAHLGRHPEDAFWHAEMGRLLRLLGRYAEAEIAIREGIHVAPGDARGYLELNAVLMDTARRVEAVEMLRDATTRVTPQDARLYDLLGYNLSDLGRTDQSVAPLWRAVTLDPNSNTNWNALGFSRFRLGDFAEARNAMIEARDAVRRRAKPGDSGLANTYDQRAKDMQRLVELAARLPAILDGSLKPTNPAETVKFGQVCQYRGFPAPALKFYREGFAANPRLAQSFDLFQAICGAVHLSTTTADPAEAADARRQALDWLRSDLPRVDRLAKGNARQVGDARLWLNRWRQTELLNPVHDPAALAKLPPDERAAWEQYWKDITTRAENLKVPDATAEIGS
jgi:serine/threonine-protein kinase